MTMAHILAAMRTQALLAANGRAVMRYGLVASYDPNTYAVKVRLQPEDTLTGWMPLVSPWVGNGWGLFAPPTVGDMIEVQFSEADPNICYAAQRFYNDADRPLAAPSGEFWLVHQSGSLLKFLNTGDVQLVTARDLNVTVGRDLAASVTRNLTASVGQDASLTVTGNTTATLNGSLTASIGSNASISVAGTITSSAAQWNHTGPVKVSGTLLVTGAITGQGGMAISGGSGSVASITGNVQVTGGITTTADVVANGISLDTHVHSGVQSGPSNTGGPH